MKLKSLLSGALEVAGAFVPGVSIAAKAVNAFLPDDQIRPEIIRLFDFAPGKTSDLWLLTHAELRNVERIKLLMQHLTQAFSAESYD